MCLTLPDLRLSILAKLERHPLPALPLGILVPPLVPRVKHLYKYCQGDSPTVYILINQSGPAVSLTGLAMIHGNNPYNYFFLHVTQKPETLHQLLHLHPSPPQKKGSAVTMIEHSI